MAKHEGKMDMREIMEVYQKLATPGVPHKLFASLEGSWTTKTKSWTDLESPPLDMSGTCEQKMLFGGRFLHQEYHGDMMGEPFTGINILGYDNHTKKYVSVWFDSMSTGIYYFEGTASADGRTIEQECRYDDPIKGPSRWRSVTRIVDDKTLEYAMYLTPRDGKEEKMMEMTVSRSVAAARKAA